MSEEIFVHDSWGDDPTAQKIRKFFSEGNKDKLLNQLNQLDRERVEEFLNDKSIGCKIVFAARLEKIFNTSFICVKNLEISHEAF